MQAFRVVQVAPASPGVGARSPWWAGFVRPKGNLTKTQVSVLLLVAVVPLLVVLIRISALPGVLGEGASGGAIPALGHALNQLLSLQSVPLDVRKRVLYLIFFPICALLISVTRLTFGIRVIGFRSILISMGFQASGVVPSLILIGVVVAVIVPLRPVFKRIRLPYYGRVSVILCIVVSILLCALLVGPLMRSEMLWRVAFFPVIVLGLLGESIAKTLDRDSGLTAAWRAGSTIGIAFLLALVCQIPALREMALQFPELIVTEIVAIVLISEFLDLQLFQGWDAKLSGVAMPRLFSNEGAYRVAVVTNRRNNQIIGRLGLPSAHGYDRRSVRRIVDALRSAGHTVKVVEGDARLLSELRDFVAPHPRTGQPGGIVFNLSQGIQGDAPHTHVPAMLEMAGVAYTGPTARAGALALDRMAAKALLDRSAIPTPAFRGMTGPRGDDAGLRYPLIVKPRYESRYKPRIVKDRQQLEDAVGVVLRRYRQPALVEEYIAGRDIQVALLGNDPVECLPLVELVSGKRKRICPAPLDEAVARRIRECAQGAFRACDGRDYARVDVRLGERADPYVLEIESVGILAEEGTFEIAAAAAGYPFDALVRRILEVARERYRPDPGARPLVLRAGKPVPGSARGNAIAG